MNQVIKELEKCREIELYQIGLTPRTNFKGNQKEHDDYHKLRADAYRKAVKILSSKIQVIDWLVSEIYEFDNLDEAETKYKELKRTNRAE